MRTSRSWRGVGKENAMRRRAAAAAMVLVMALAGCTISRDIIDTPPPADQPRLEQLEEHLDSVDPDAGQPDYIRTD